jgi:CRISPR-associated Csx14 family protein
MTYIRNNHRSILIATLGSEPQVVTAALDLLRLQGEAIDTVCVLHSTSPGTAMESALEALMAEFSGAQGQMRVAFTPLCDESGRALQDVQTPEETQAAFRFLYRQVRMAKLEGQRVHLLVAGGRKTLALFGMAAAQLLFDEGDRLWHLYSGGEFLASKRMHPQLGDDVHLIPIPVLLWSQVSPVLSDLDGVDDPFEAAEHARQLRLNEKMEIGRTFVLGSLTPAEATVVRLLVESGLSDQEIAGRLSLSPRTVEQHLRSAYRKAAAHWELPDAGRAQLVALLSLYYGLGGGS